jgi:tRNA (uracil-5-)-methyltransferase TRM9
MDLDTAARLIELNRHFYDRFGRPFSATRQRIPPGVRSVLGLLKGDESILDLGCGNGELARELAKRGQRGSYVGVDFSLPLLQDAETLPKGFSARFVQADLTSLSLMDIIASSRKVGTRQSQRNGEIALSAYSSPRMDMFDVVCCFAVLHHIPSHEFRLSILRIVRQLLTEDGLFIHSNWQFLNSEKLRARIQPWQAAEIPTSAVDAGDYLLDWRSGGKGLRYLHHFDEKELDELAKAVGFRVSDAFYSDGDGGRLGLYQIWRLAS